MIDRLIKQDIFRRSINNDYHKRLHDILMNVALDHTLDDLNMMDEPTLQIHIRQTYSTHVVMLDEFVKY